METAMRIANYKAHHVLGVKDIEFNLEGHHLFLVGGDNEQGKTSATKALLMALCGRSGMDFPDIALRDGEDEGWVDVDLLPDVGERGLKVELFLKRQRGGQVVEKLRVTDDAGNEVKEPRSLLKRLTAIRAFDPLEFERLDKKAKRELLCKLLGLDFTEETKARKKLYDERAEVNRDGVKLKAKFDDMPHHRDAPKQEVKVADLVAERQDRERHNANNAKERARLTEMDEAIADRAEEIATADAKLAELRRQIAVMEKERESLVSQQENAVLVRNAHELTVKVLEDKSLAEIDLQIQDAETTNRMVRDNLRRGEVEVELAELRKRSAALTAKIEDIDAAHQQAIRDAKWPIDGLGIDEEGVTYNGLPFEQASKSKRIIVSTLIGMSLNPGLRLLVCEDGNDLGNQAMKDLEALLKEKGYQMILEVVTRSAEDEARCAVVIEAGANKAKRN